MTLRMDYFDLDLNANHLSDAPSLNLNAVTPYFNSADSASPTNRSDDIDEDAILSLMISNGIMDYPSDVLPRSHRKNLLQTVLK